MAVSAESLRRQPIRLSSLADLKPYKTFILTGRLDTLGPIRTLPDGVQAKPVLEGQTIVEFPKQETEKNDPANEFPKLLESYSPNGVSNRKDSKIAKVVFETGFEPRVKTRQRKEQRLRRRPRIPAEALSQEEQERVRQLFVELEKQRPSIKRFDGRDLSKRGKNRHLR